ncbi:hypothetical protein D3C81_2124760 [compost metagenome]
MQGTDVAVDLCRGVGSRLLDHPGIDLPVLVEVGHQQDCSLAITGLKGGKVGIDHVLLTPIDEIADRASDGYRGFLLAQAPLSVR